MSRFTEADIDCAVNLLEAHRRHCDMHYEDTIHKIQLATGLSEKQVLDLVRLPEVEDNG